MSAGLIYNAGVSGTYTVPDGHFATGFSCFSSGGGTLVITPVGEPAGDTITIPKGVSFSLTKPLLGTEFQLNAGSTLAFVGTDTYVVILEVG